MAQIACKYFIDSQLSELDASTEDWPSFDELLLRDAAIIWV
jgi:hypothetical protein